MNCLNEVGQCESIELRDPQTCRALHLFPPPLLHEPSRVLMCKIGARWEAWEHNCHHRKVTKPSFLWSKNLELFKVGNKTWHSTGHDERVEKAHVYLWRKGRRHPRPAPIPCETFHWGGEKALLHIRPTKDSRQFATIGRRGRITEKAPNLDSGHTAWLKLRVSKDNKDTTSWALPPSG